jgi:sugar lactone lactonase YvrE
MDQTMMTKLGDLRFLGSGLQRPECVLTTASGDLFVTDPQGVAILSKNGAVRRVAARGTPDGFFPNGIAMLPGREVLIADLGPGGGVWLLKPDGTFTPWLMEVDGTRLPPTNFVGVDKAGRRWVTVSTRLFPRTLAAKPGWGDGFIVLQDERGIRIVADGIGYTNEAVVSPDGQFIYVNETYGRRLSRYAIRADNSLGAKEVVCSFGPGTFPDGLAHDADGNVWIVSVVSNRVIKVDTKSGKEELFFEDSDTAEIAALEAEHMQDGGDANKRHAAGAARTTKNLASIAFGGPGLRTIYCGSLEGTQVVCFDSPVAGTEPPHWHY